MMNEYLELFLTWAKIGGFTYGGGYAMLPLIIEEIANKKHWASEEEIMDYYALSQCTPGVLAVNIATFVGDKRKGILGGIIATIGVITPSIIIISLIALFLNNFAEYEIVKHGLNGISIAVCVLMTKTIYKMGRSSLKDVKTISIFIASFICAYFLGVKTIVISIGAIVIGLVLNKLENKKC